MKPAKVFKSHAFRAKWENYIIENPAWKSHSCKIVLKIWISRWVQLLNQIPSIMELDDPIAFTCLSKFFRLTNREELDMDTGKPNQILTTKQFGDTALVIQEISILRSACMHIFVCIYQTVVKNIHSNMLMGLQRSAAYVPRYDDLWALQFALSFAICWVLHRCQSRAMHPLGCLQLRLYIDLFLNNVLTKIDETYFRKTLYWRKYGKDLNAPYIVLFTCHGKSSPSKPLSLQDSIKMHWLDLIQSIQWKLLSKQ